MNSIQRKANKLATTICLLAVCSSLLIACGGDSSDTTAGIGGTGIVSGQITGFGSIHVNGSKFDIDTSSFTVDGQSFVGKDGQDQLALGMVVQLRVGTENGVFTNTALEVVYDDEIEGPISNVRLSGAQRIATILRQEVIFDETTTIFDANGFLDNLGAPLGFGSIGVNHVVEVSGFRISATEIAATYVRVVEDLVNPGNTEVELRGTIDQYMGGSTFEIEGTLINFDPAGVTTDIDVSGGVIRNGLNVEVKGVFLANLLVDAEKIEEEDEDFGDDVDEINLQGIISMFNDIADFEIDGQAVDASTATLSPASAAGLLADPLTANGLNVEVEGEIVNGVLIADELELREGETKLKSFVSFVYPDNIRFEVNYAGLPGSILVHTNGQTLFDDEGPLQLPNFSVADMNVGDFVIVEGIESADEVTAGTVKRKDSTNPDDSELEGQVDTFVLDTSITVLGITYDVSVADFEDATGTVSPAVFFDQLRDGDIVEIKDDVTADGIADEVELE